MGAHEENISAVRGSACEFLGEYHMQKCNAEEGRVLEADADRSRDTGSGDTDVKDICG